MCGFLLVVNMNGPCISHSCRDIELQRYQGHDLDLLGLRDVMCHVTSGFPMCGYLLVVNMNAHVSRTVVEILSFKVIWVTTLAFCGHVTTSVT